MVIIFFTLLVIMFIGMAYYLGHDDGFKERGEEVGRLSVEGENTKLLLKESESRYVETYEQVQQVAAELKKTKSQKKSSEVRTGLIVEQMAPFLEGFPYDPRTAIFLGKPLDFLVFDEEGIHFVEVKSGNAQLSTSQRRIRDQLKDKKVTFEVYRIKGE